MSADPLSAALMPTLVHQLNNTTQLVTGLQALMNLPGGGDLPLDPTEQLSSAAREVDASGWCLAVLATAAGSDLVLARRRRDALRLIVDLVRHGLRRDGADLALATGPIPSAATDAVDECGWKAAWSTGLVLWCAGASSREWGFRREGEHDVLCLHGAADAPLADQANLLRERVPEVRLERRDDDWRLALPTGWLQRGESREVGNA